MKICSRMDLPKFPVKLSTKGKSLLFVRSILHEISENPITIIDLSFSGRTILGEMNVLLLLTIKSIFFQGLSFKQFSFLTIESMIIINLMKDYPCGFQPYHCIHNKIMD